GDVASRVRPDTASDSGRRRKDSHPAFQSGQFGFEGCNPGLELLVLFPSTLSHSLDRLELVAPYDIHLAEHALALGFHERLDLAAQTLSGACRVRHHLRQLVENPIGGPGHGSSRQACHLRIYQPQGRDSFIRKLIGTTGCVVPPRAVSVTRAATSLGPWLHFPITSYPQTILELSREIS